MQPLYCFKLDESTGRIAKFEIEDYMLVMGKTRDVDIYKFEGKFGTSINCRYNVRACDLDRYVAKKVFTFNGELSYAFKIIKTTIRERQKNAEHTSGKCKAILSRLRFPESFLEKEKW